MSASDNTPQSDSVREIEQEIERTRGELADTVEALAYKADVPARAREKATAVKERAAEKATVAKHVAAEKATVAKNAATEKAAHAKNRASETATHTAHVARQKADGAVHSAQESPPRTKAAIGAGVAACAAAVASIWYVVRRRRS
jgi:hypothetical protein